MHRGLSISTETGWTAAQLGAKSSHQTITMDTHSSSNYPFPTQVSLQDQYVGKKLEDLPTPAAVIDRAIVKGNCDAMLDVCQKLGVGFRAHVKSHKVEKDLFCPEIMIMRDDVVYVWSADQNIRRSSYPNCKSGAPVPPTSWCRHSSKPKTSSRWR